MRVLVTGGTGVVGRPAIKHLIGRGHQVRLLSRNAERDAQDWDHGVEPFPAQVGDAGSLKGAADGCDAVLHMAGIASEDPPETTFDSVNVGGTRNVLAEAERAGVRRFVFVSSLGAERGQSGYHRSKLESEGLVRGFSKSWLILRPGNVYGPGDEVISLLLKMVRTLPAVPVVGGGDQPFQPIWSDDLGIALARAVDDEKHAGEVLELAGNDIITNEELLDRLSAVTGKKPLRVPLPGKVATAGAEAAEALGMDLPIHPAQFVMLSEGSVISPGGVNALTEVFGVEPTSLDDGLAALADSQPEAMPSEGSGDLRLHRYWVDISGSQHDAESLLRLVRSEFGTLADDDLMKVGVEPGSAAELDEGATLTLAIPFRGNVQVRVEEVHPREVTAMTLEGHPLAGVVRFQAEDVDRDAGGVRFEVRTYARAGNLLDRAVTATFGAPMKHQAWVSLLDAVVERSGGTSSDGPDTSQEVLEGAEAAELEEWAEELVRRRRQKEES
jgi:NADH dehydrogenase